VIVNKLPGSLAVEQAERSNLLLLRLVLRRVVGLQHLGPMLQRPSELSLEPGCLQFYHDLFRVDQWNGLLDLLIKPSLERCVLFRRECFSLFEGSVLVEVVGVEVLGHRQHVVALVKRLVFSFCPHGLLDLPITAHHLVARVAVGDVHIVCPTLPHQLLRHSTAIDGDGVILLRTRPVQWIVGALRDGLEALFILDLFHVVLVKSLDVMLHLLEELEGSGLLDSEIR
jgi:hypothetical protein